MSGSNQKPIRKPTIVLREEFDDWAILFDPDTGEGNTIDPVSVFIWKQLDGTNSVEDILTNLKKEIEDVPQNAGEKIKAFVDELLESGLINDQ